MEALFLRGTAMGKIVHAGRTWPWWRSLLRSRLLTVLGLLAISSAAYVAVDERRELSRVHRSSTSNAAFHRAGCDIKGNINETGEHIFRVPGRSIIWLRASIRLEVSAGSARSVGGLAQGEGVKVSARNHLCSFVKIDWEFFTIRKSRYRQNFGQQYKNPPSSLSLSNRL